MRRRTFLALAAFAVPATVRCASGGGGAVVRVVTPTATLAAPPGTPTPTLAPAPPPELILSATDVYQAGAVLVSVVGQLKGGQVAFAERVYPLTQGKRSMYAFVGVGADDPTGPLPLRADFTTAAGSKGSLTAEVNVIKTAWTVDSITIPAHLSRLLDPAVTAADLAQVAEVYAGVTNQKLWDGGWQIPVNGAITTRFGEQRSYNGAAVSGHHSGTDIGAPEGAPVVASNSGRVAMARQLQARGNMVAVDHGGGLFSGYAHLSAFAVAEGQAVAGGDLLGYVGTTGLSTGAHLHWEMSAGGVLVDAIRFTDGTNGF
jgi:hypothetical protein